MTEWRSVQGYEGKYEVQDNGQVRKVSGILLKQSRKDQGYPLVRLSRPRKLLSVHRLVAKAFILNPRNCATVNHIDFVRHNNHVSNLEWCTQKENLAHSERAGRMHRTGWLGQRAPNAKVSDETVIIIRNEYAEGGISWKKLGIKYNISKRTMGRIIKNES